MSGLENTFGYYQTETQFGQLFYNELGGTPGNSIPSNRYFSNAAAGMYWLDTEAGNYEAFMFGTINGFQKTGYKEGSPYAGVWAVSPNYSLDVTLVTTIPLPSSLWLFGTGLLGLLNMKRSKSRLARVGRFRDSKTPYLL